MRIYLASSWRNPYFDDVFEWMNQIWDVYNFKTENAFSWDQLDPDWRSWSFAEYANILATHPRADEGFATDRNALLNAQAVVLLLPCGNSAHIELGAAIRNQVNGRRPFTAIYKPKAEGIFSPDLMYKFAHLITDNETLLHAALTQYASSLPDTTERRV